MPRFLQKWYWRDHPNSGTWGYKNVGKSWKAASKMIPNDPLLLVFMPLGNAYPQCPRAGLLWPMAHSRGDGTTVQLTWNAPGVGVRGMACSSILPSLITHSGGNQLLCPEDTETALGTGPLPVRNWGPQTHTWLSWKAGPSATLSLEMTAAPTNSLTATSGETQSQNHPTKAFQIPDSWKWRNNKCLLFETCSTATNI